MHVDAQSQDSIRIVQIFADILTKPEEKTSLFQEAQEIKVRAKSNQNIQVTYLYNWSKYLMYAGELDSSIAVSNQGLQLYEKQKSDFGQVRFLNLVASVNSLQQKNEKAIRLFKKSLAISELNNEEKQAAYIKNNIANIFISMLDYNSAYEYVQDAYKILKKYPDDLYLASITSVLGVSELKLNRFEEARKHGQEALALAEKQGNITALIVANYTLGEIELHQKGLINAEDYFTISLELSENYRQLHYVMLNCIGLMNLQIEKKEFTQGIDFGERALELASKQNNKNIIYSIKKHLADAYAGIGDYQKAYTLLNQAHRTFLTTYDKETQRSINDILVKYDTEKKEKEIAKNKLLLLEKEVESTRLTSWILFLIFTLLILVVSLLSIRAKNKRKVNQIKNEQERKVLNAIIEGEELERERMASELHDGLASILTAAKYRVENLGSTDFEDKSEILGVLNNAQIETRRIAHNLAPLNLLRHGLIGALRQFSQENSTQKTFILFNSNVDHLDLPKENALIIYRVTQELVQNALKHASPNQIDVQLMVDNDELRLSVEDDGIGFDLSNGIHSNGLSHIQHRAEKLGGSFEIDSSLHGAGTVALFSLPLNTIN